MKTINAQENTLTEADISYFQNKWPKMQEAWNMGDREPYIAAHKTSNYMIPFGETLTGAADIRSYVESFPEGRVDFSGFDIMGNQGLVAVRGDFAYNLPNGDLMDKGKFIGLFQKNAAGDWEMTHALWNSDLPLPG